MPESYYSDDFVTIYHGDCREILPHIEADVIITDPPYGFAFKSGWTGSEIAGDTTTELRDWLIGELADTPAAVFGDAREALLPGAVTGLIWHRPGSGMGNLSLPWKIDHERIHIFGNRWEWGERGDGVLRFQWDVFRGDAAHPHQKPIALMRHLIERSEGVILDPFMGSGSTLRAAKDLGRKAIGIELEEKYCEIAAERCSQEVLDLGMAA